MVCELIRRLHTDGPKRLGGDLMALDREYSFPHGTFHQERSFRVYEADSRSWDVCVRRGSWLCTGCGSRVRHAVRPSSGARISAGCEPCPPGVGPSTTG